MIEKTFIAPILQRENLKELKKYLLRAINDNNGIMTEMEDGSNYSLLVAYPDAQKEVFNKIIRTELTRFFSYYFKIDFFKKNLVLKMLNNVYSEMFIRALSRFDQNLDIRDITLAIYEFNIINLQSFFYFRLTGMKRRWEELIKLTNENTVWQLSKQSFEDLLKFLISNLESQIDFVDIVINDKTTIIYDKNNNLITQKKIKAEFSQFWIVMALIKFSPKNINIQANENINLSLIDKFFDANIKLK